MHFYKATAILLAGGKSSRMGTDKSLLPVGDKPLIEHILEQIRSHFDQILLSANHPDRYDSLGVEIVEDREKDKGPLMGLISTIAKSQNELNFVQACDIPSTDLNLVREMLAAAGGYDAVVPKNADGRLEPLFAVYRKSALKAMEHVLAHERGKVHLVPRFCKTKIIELASTDALHNLNTIEEYNLFVKSRK